MQKPHFDFLDLLPLDNGAPIFDTEMEDVEDIFINKINYLTSPIDLVCVEGVGIGPALHLNWKDQKYAWRQRKPG